MKFSYNAVWDRTLALLGAHAPLIGAIAGVFIFLPSLLVGHFFPVPQGSSTDPQVELESVAAYWSATWYWQLVAVVATLVGTLAILILVLDHTRPTVGGAIARAIRLLPTYLLASVLVFVALILGAFLCVLPFAIVAAAGLTAFVYLGFIAILVLMAYASGRLSVMASVASLEHLPPLSMIRRALELTRNHGWAILGLLILILLAGGIASLAVAFVIGGLLRLLLNAELADFLILLIGTAFNAALTAVLIVTTGSIYRELSGSESTASLFD